MVSVFILMIFFLNQIYYCFCTDWNNVIILLSPPNEVWGKVMFSQVSVILCTGGLHQGVSIQGGLGRHPLGYYGIWSTSGRYASYWKAFLFSEHLWKASSGVSLGVLVVRILPGSTKRKRNQWALPVSPGPLRRRLVLVLFAHRKVNS